MGVSILGTIVRGSRGLDEERKGAYHFLLGHELSFDSLQSSQKGLRLPPISDSFRMPTAIFFAADFKVSVECAGRRCNGIAAQHTEPLSCRYQFFVLN
jgi:hypothetical protein